MLSTDKTWFTASLSLASRFYLITHTYLHTLNAWTVNDLRESTWCLSSRSFTWSNTGDVIWWCWWYLSRKCIFISTIFFYNYRKVFPEKKSRRVQRIPDIDTEWISMYIDGFSWIFLFLIFPMIERLSFSIIISARYDRLCKENQFVLAVPGDSGWISRLCGGNRNGSISKRYHLVRSCISIVREQFGYRIPGFVRPWIDNCRCDRFLPTLSH